MSCCHHPVVFHCTSLSFSCIILCLLRLRPFLDVNFAWGQHVETIKAKSYLFAGSVLRMQISCRVDARSPWLAPDYLPMLAKVGGIMFTQQKSKAPALAAPWYRSDLGSWRKRQKPRTVGPGGGISTIIRGCFAPHTQNAPANAGSTSHGAM